MRNAFVFAGILTASFATRWPFRSHLLYHWDSVDFALGMHDYNVALHQPHPPGYFVYVMLARVLYFFVRDDNASLVLLSILGTGIATYLLWRLATRMFGDPVGIFSSLAFFFSPLVWFYGEVGLSYIVSAAVVLGVTNEAWKLLEDADRPTWRIGLLVALAGGIRQNLAVFLFPLWLYAIRRRTFRNIGLSLTLLGVGCAAWFVPMVTLSGGWSAYRGAVEELWRFHTGQWTILAMGLDRVRASIEYLFAFCARGLGAFFPFLFFEFYVRFRQGRLSISKSPRARFLTLWLLPFTVFYMVVYITPVNQGYILDLLPGLIMISILGALRFTDSIREGINWLRDRGRIEVFALGFFLAVINVSVLFLSHYPVSFFELRDHDQTLSRAVEEIKAKFKPDDTLIVSETYLFYGYRHAMYYLPEFISVDLDPSLGPQGELRQVFWGKGRKTWTTPSFVQPSGMTTLVAVLDPRVTDRREKLDHAGLTKPDEGETAIYRYGSIELLRAAYPYVKRLYQSR